MRRTATTPAQSRQDHHAWPSITARRRETSRRRTWPPITCARTGRAWAITTTSWTTGRSTSAIAWNDLIPRRLRQHLLGRHLPRRPLHGRRSAARQAACRRRASRGLPLSRSSTSSSKTSRATRNCPRRRPPVRAATGSLASEWKDRLLSAGQGEAGVAAVRSTQRAREDLQTPGTLNTARHIAHSQPLRSWRSGDTSGCSLHEPHKFVHVLGKWRTRRCPTPAGHAACDRRCSVSCERSSRWPQERYVSTSAPAASKRPPDQPERERRADDTCAPSHGQAARPSRRPSGGLGRPHWYTLPSDASQAAQVRDRIDHKVARREVDLVP